MNQGRILDGFDLIYGLLQVYNSASPYIQLREWQGVQCHDCHNSVQTDQTKRCWRCERTFCSTCARHCSTCNRDFCRNCGTQSTTNRREYTCPCLNSMLCSGGCGVRYDRSQLRTGVVGSRSYTNYCEYCLYQLVTGNPSPNRPTTTTVQPPRNPVASPAGTGQRTNFDNLVAEDRRNPQPVQPARPVAANNPQWRQNLTLGSLDDLMNDLRGTNGPPPTPTETPAVPVRRRRRHPVTGQWETVSE